MKRCTSLFIALFLISFICPSISWASWNNIPAASTWNVEISRKIVRPWRATTEIVKPGESFDVWFNADAGQVIQSVQLKGPYNTVNCSKSVTTGNWEYDRNSGNKYNTRISVTVPTGTPDDRYDLVVKTSHGDEVSWGGVKVVKEAQDNYYIMHISDGHLFQANHDSEVLLARKSVMIDMANIMDVPIIIETGDMMYNIRNNPEHELAFHLGVKSSNIIGMTDARAATFYTPGNHDAPDRNNYTYSTQAELAAYWNKYWGLQSHSFKYGNGRFMIINNDYYWRDNQYPAHDAGQWLGGNGAGGNFFLSAGHHYDKMHDIIDGYEPLSLVLAGHRHYISGDNPEPFTRDGSGPEVAYTAGSIRDNFEFNLFRVNNSSGNYDVVPGPTSVAQVLHQGNKSNRSSWVPNLTLSYSNANNGSVTANTATIDNKFNFPIYGARVRFVVPKGNNYQISKGTVLQQFEGDSYCIVDVKIDVAANDTESVSLSVLDGGGEASVAIASPATNSSFDAVPGFTVTVDGSHSSGFQWMRLWVDDGNGSEVYEILENSPWEFNVSGLTAGTYSLFVRARDNSGGTTDSESITVTLNSGNSTQPSGDIGSILCWHYKEIYGGHDYAFNQSMLKKRFPNDHTHWSDNMQWWENIVEEIDYSGMDYVALLSRGNQPNAPDRGNGNPKHIPKLIDAMQARGANFKVAIFDDVPNSWTGSKNWNESGGTHFSSTNPKFDLSNTDNYKYIWDYNLKQVYQHVPDGMRYKIEGRPVIFFWNLRDTWFTNIEGSLKPILDYIRAQCQAEFGFNPFIIVQHTWLENDSQLSKNDVDAVHSWFSAASGNSWTLVEENSYKIGVVVPGLREPEASDHLDPAMGTNDNSTRLRYGLDNTVGAGARTTLIEGFTNAAEAAALWRSNDQGTHTFYDYPNQRLNVVRSYTSNPFPETLKMEAEACDFHHDLTSGNSGGAYLYMGDLDVVKCSDAGGGWNVTHTQANEWMEWRELPLLANTKLQLRYKSSAASSIRFTVGGQVLSTINLPSTNNVWTTIDAGNYINASNSLQTVRLTILSGSPDINYFLRVSGEGSINSAAFVSQSGVPSTMTPGESATVSVTMKNTGTTTWTKASAYKLGSQPGGSSTWGFTRIELDPSDNIAPNESKTFTFTITAPTTAGTYDFQTKMVQEFVEWFDNASTNMAIAVEEQSASVVISSPTNNSSFHKAVDFKLTVDASHPAGFEWMRLWADKDNEGYQVIYLINQSPWEFDVSGLSAGTYSFYVRARDNDGGTTDSEVLTVTITENASVVISSPADNASFGIGTDFKLTVAASHASGFEWMRLWADKDNEGYQVLYLINQGLWEFDVSGLSAGTYSFYVRARDNDGGTTDSEIITVVITDNASLVMTSSGKISVAAKDISIYPNPADEGIVSVGFDLGSLSKVGLSILDMNGSLVSQPIFNQSFEPGTHKLDVPLFNIQPGIYLMQITFDGVMQVHKVVVM